MIISSKGVEIYDMKHEKEWHTCDRCGKIIENKFFRRLSIPYTIKYVTFEERAYEIEKSISKVMETMKVESGEIIADYGYKDKLYDLCPKCRKDFERFMKNE